MSVRDPDKWNTIWNRYNAVLLCIGLVLLAISLAWEHIAQGGAPGLSFLENSNTWINLSKEIAFALFIALAIIVFIERRQREEQHQEHTDRVKQLEESAITAIFGIATPRSIVDRVFNDVLRQEVFRHEFSATFRFSVDDFPADPEGIIRAVQMSATVSYFVENLTDSSVKYPVSLIVERPMIRGLLTLNEGATDVVRITDVVIGSRRYTREEIDEADKKDPDEPYEKRFQQIIDIEANSKVHVSLSFVTVRGLDDAEYWWTNVPADGMTLRVKMPKEIDAFGAYTPLVSRLKNSFVLTHDEEHYKEWCILRSVLPHEGIYFWWRHSDSQRRPADVPPENSGEEPRIEGSHEPDTQAGSAGLAGIKS